MCVFTVSNVLLLRAMLATNVRQPLHFRLHCQPDCLCPRFCVCRAAVAWPLRQNWEGPPWLSYGPPALSPKRKGTLIWDQPRCFLLEWMRNRMADGPWAEQAGEEGSWGDRCSLHTCLANWYKELFCFIQSSLEEKRCTLFLALTHIHMPARPVQMQAAGPRA